jgi:hypothetical protein
MVGVERCAFKQSRACAFCLLEYRKLLHVLEHDTALLRHAHRFPQVTSDSWNILMSTVADGRAAEYFCWTMEELKFKVT